MKTEDRQQVEPVGYVPEKAIEDIKKWAGATLFISDEASGRNTIPLFTSPPQHGEQEGMVMVPVEPTTRMCAAGFAVSEAEHDPAGVYKAMIAAK